MKVNASAVLALVKRGETVEITERGKPVALLVPRPADSVFDRWVVAGRVSAARGSLDDDEPIRDGTPGSLTAALLALREGDER